MNLKKLLRSAEGCRCQIRVLGNGHMHVYLCNISFLSNCV